MTTEVDKEISEEAAHRALTERVKIERALNRAYQEIADSLGLKDRAAVQKHLDDLNDTIKRYLIDNGGQLHDGEFDVTARVQVRSNISYDLPTAAQTEQGPAALAEAARAGLLKLDNKGLEKFRGSSGTSSAAWADHLWKFRNAHGATYALMPLEWGKK